MSEEEVGLHHSESVLRCNEVEEDVLRVGHNGLRLVRKPVVVEVVEDNVEVVVRTPANCRSIHRNCLVKVGRREVDNYLNSVANQGTLSWDMN